MSERPAEIAGLPDQGRPIAVGEPANLRPRRPGRGLDGARRGAGQPRRPTPRTRACGCPRRWSRRCCAGGSRAKDGKAGAASRTGGAGARGRPDLPRRGLRRARAGPRRGRVHHRDDRLPGDADRPLLPPPDRGATAPQIGNTGWNDEDDESARDPGGGLRGARPAADAVELALPAAARRRAAAAGDRRRRGRRHPRAGAAPARAGRDAGRGVLRRRAGPRRRAGGPRCSQSPPMAGADLYGAVTTREPYVVPADGRAPGSGSRRSTSGSSRTPRGCSPPAASRPTCCPRTTPIEQIEELGAGRVLPVQRARATRPRPTARWRSPGRCWSGGSRCSASASATRSSARALGRGTYKLRYGHRGINIPVVEHATGRVAITSQNHGFAVRGRGGGAVRHPVRPGADHPHLPERRLRRGPAGARRARRSACSTTPRPRPGPHDAADLFDRFVELMAASTALRLRECLMPRATTSSTSW